MLYRIFRRVTQPARIIDWIGSRLKSTERRTEDYPTPSGKPPPWGYYIRYSGAPRVSLCEPPWKGPVE